MAGNQPANQPWSVVLKHRNNSEPALTNKMANNAYQKLLTIKNHQTCDSCHHQIANNGPRCDLHQDAKGIGAAGPTGCTP